MHKRILLTFLVIVLSNLAVNAQIDTILNRYRQYLFRTEHPRNIPKLMALLNQSGSWPDINYENESRAEWQMMKHLERVQNMSVAWSNPASKYFHQPGLKQAIDQSFDYWLYHRFYNPNWWYNEIGIPNFMQNILILLRRHLSKYQHTRSIEELGQYRINGTGSNLIWSAELGFFYGALTNDTTWMRHCIDTIFHEIKINTGEGIQPDYSFHMHGNRLQIYSYGKAFLTVNLRLAMITRGTTWAYPKEKINLLVNFVLKGWQWMCRGVNTVPGTIDRGVSHKDALHAGDIRDLIPDLCNLEPEKSNELLMLAARQNGNGRPLAGFHYYPYSDFAAFQTKNFSFFLKTISIRTSHSESINGENLKGHLLNSGDAYLIRNGHEYFNLMPVWKWDKIPGVTAFAGAKKIIRKPFAGSVTNSISGLTAMDYDLGGTDSLDQLTAHKIWACHNNMIVCLIAGLTAHNIHGDIFTTLDQCRRHGTVTVNNPSNIIKEGDHILQQIRWIHHADFSYILLRPSTIGLFSDTSSGTWSSINASAADTLVTDSIFMPVIFYGRHPKDLSTGYVLTYCPDAKQAAALADHPVWKILCNDDTSQAVLFNDGTLMAAFFSAGTLRVTNQERISVDRPCLVLISSRRSVKGEEKIYLSDPMHKGGMLRIQVNHHKKNIILPDDGTTAMYILSDLK